MKSALCISGQLRFVDQCYNLCRENLLNHNDIDIFIHCWYDENELDKPYKFGGNGKWIDQRIQQNADELAIGLYKPKLIKLDKYKQFKNSQIDFNSSIAKYFRGALERPDLEPDFRNRMINNMHSMWYSAQQSYLLCQEYSLANDIQYDCVIKSRFDLELNTPIYLKDYDINLLHYGNLHQPDDMISDWFNFSSYDNIGAYFSIFNCFNLLAAASIKEQNAFCNELLIKHVAKAYGINSQMHNWNITLPRF